MLRGTSRKYLLQSVFGGQTCSQVVCQECGTCKNRIEDFYNLSLTVKDIKSMHDSLKTLVDGEVINDYECDTCKKKVDISKRVLLSSTPNVLIVHLQRIIFNFDTFRNDKINSLFEFPSHLDLKPYSFYEVMRKENRLNKKEANEEDSNQGSAPNDVPQQKQNEDSKMPEEDDCWEYKLVGVTVHSGTANAGHYWSLINTRRGHAEPPNDSPQWAATESEQWMEFNDSTVRNFNFEKLKEECFGEDKSTTGGESAWGNFGSYGKSAYMLIYERRIKKPIKILVDAEEAKKDPTDIHYDEKKEEHYRLVDYKTGVEEIEPSSIY
jgi:ubiquitin carboxyl-terminal hydrolase 34